MGVATYLAICVVIIVEVRVDARYLMCKEVEEEFTEEVCGRIGSTTQGRPGKRGERGEPGLRGPAGAPGPRSDVDYVRVNAMVVAKVDEALGRMKQQLQTMSEHMETLELKQAICEMTYDGKCFWSVVHSSKDIDVSDATAICEGRGSKLANIYDATHFNLIMNHLRQKIPSGYRIVWTGLTINPMNGAVSLRDGRAAPYKRWRSSNLPQTGSRHASEKNIYLYVPADAGASDQGMGNDPPTSSFHGVICEI